MITTGQPSFSATKTEIVDLEDGATCSDLADFPVEIEPRSVGANLDGTPVVCGGYFSEYSEKCYRFKNGGWEEFVNMTEKRRGAAGIMYNKKLYVFGGRSSSSSILQTSESINVDGSVSNGPDLPTGVFAHAMASINYTVSLLSGGFTSTNSYSAQTWYYNHDTEVFTPGPDLLEGRRDHGSATIVDKVTKANIVVVTGGSTELLINGQWEIGTIQCKIFWFALVLYLSLGICQT